MRTVCGSKFLTDGAENWKACLEKSVPWTVGPAAGWKVNATFNCSHVPWVGRSGKPERDCNNFWFKLNVLIKSAQNVTKITNKAETVSLQCTLKLATRSHHGHDALRIALDRYHMLYMAQNQLKQQANSCRCPLETAQTPAQHWAFRNNGQTRDR